MVQRHGVGMKAKRMDAQDRLKSSGVPETG